MKYKVLEEISKHIPGVIFAKDLDGKFIYANEEYEHLFQFKKDWLIGKTTFDFMPGDIAEKLKANEQMVLAEGMPHQFDDEIQVNDERRIYSCIMFPLRDEAGKIYGVAGISTDITESKRNADALKETNARLEALINAIPDMVIFKDTECRHLLMNKAVEKILGRSSENAEGKTNEEVLRPEVSAMCRASDEKALTALEPVHIDESIVTPSGEKIHLDTIKAPIHDERGKLMGLVIVSRDITRRKRYEEALRKSEQRFRGFFEHIPVGMFIINFEGRFIHVNEFFCQFIGYDEEEILRFEAYPQKKYTHPDDLKESLKNFHLLMSGEIPDFIQEKRHLRKDGRVVWGRVSATCRLEDDGPSYIGIVEDIDDRKRAEEELRQAQSLIEDITRGTDDLIAAQDGEYRYLFFNEAYDRELQHLWGVDTEVGTSMVEAMAAWPEDLRKTKELLSRALAGESFRITEEFGPTEAKRQYYDIRFNPLRDAQGRVFGAAHIRRNVTEQVRTLKALQESEERYRLVNLSTHDVIWDWNMETDNIDWGGSVAEMFGISSEELGPDINGWYSRIHPEDLGRVMDSIHTAIDNGSDSWTDEYRFFAGRQWKYFLDRGHIARDDRGKAYRMIGSMMDITEIKEAEATLRESEAQFRQLAESMPQAVWITRADGYHEYFNERWYEFTGTAPGETHGDPWSGLLHPDDYQRTMETWQNSLRTGEPYTIEYRFKSAVDGRYHWFLARALPIRNEQGHITRWFGTCTYIQEQKEIQHELARSNRELEQFAYITSHDLQAPLRSITGHLELLARRYKGKLDARAEEFIGFAVEGARRMQQLINDILTLSRVGTSAVSFEPVETNVSLAKALVSLQAEIEESGAEVTFTGLPAVAGDPSQIVQLLQNLVGNALKYSRPDEPPRVHIDAEEKETMWEFRVRDNGIGIPPGQQENIFRIFQRLHAESDYPGTGIGLAICQKIVERHKGRIWVESEPGKGSTFFFTLPNAGEQNR